MKDLPWFNELSASEQKALLEGPAMTPPLGISNLVDPPNKNSLTFGISIASAVLCTLLVLLRVYSRVTYHKKLAIEDGESGQLKPMRVHCFNHVLMLTRNGYCSSSMLFLAEVTHS
jgi:hypothetical protein